MAIVTLTEHNRNSSRVLRLADVEDVVLTERGQPVYRITRIGKPPEVDRLTQLIRSGIFAPPRPDVSGIGASLPRVEAREAITNWELGETGRQYDY